MPWTLCYAYGDGGLDYHLIFRPKCYVNQLHILMTHAEGITQAQYKQ